MPSIGLVRARSRIVVDGAILVVEAHRDGGVLPGIVEHVAPIGREDELDAEPLGRFAEHARLISGGGGEEKNAGHGHSRAEGEGQQGKGPHTRLK